MAEPISIQQLKDASEDAITLSDFIYKPANVMIPRRLAADINSLQYYLDYMSSYAQHSYETYDEMVANAPNLPENVSVFVTNDLDAAKNGIYTYSGTSFVKGDYQPENAAKEFVEAKLGGLEVFDGKVRTQDVSTSDGSTQESKNIEFRSELDALPFEGGVLADTFVAMTKKEGVGTVARTLRDVNSETYSVKDFGALGDGSAAKVSQWFTVGSTHYRGYANLEAVQLDYPHVVNGSDTIDFAAIQAAINSKLPITIPKGVYSISRTLKTQRNTVLKGQGRDSVLEALGITGAVILTYSGAGEPTAPNQDIGNFSIVGTATCAIAFAHFAHSKAELIYLSTDSNQFIGVDGFVFEYFWATKISQLFTNGAKLSGTPFVCNKGVLDTIFDLLYTSNLSDYMLLIDSSKTQYSTGTGWGTGRVSFNLFTAQGARKYAMYLKDASNVHFYSLYTENNIGALRIDSAAGITFNSCDMSGTKIVSEHDVWIDSSNSINSNASITSIGFNNCLFLQTPKKIIGKVTSGITFNHCSTVGLQPLFPLIQRTENTPSGMPIYINEQRTDRNVMYLKTNDYSWRFAKIEAASASGIGTWASNPVEIPPLTALTVY